MPAIPSADRPGTTDQLARYATPTALLAAVLLVLSLAVRLVSVPLCLAALLTDRTAAHLDHWLAALPLPAQPVHATATRLPAVIAPAS
jgi:hypothetical protein